MKRFLLMVAIAALAACGGDDGTSAGTSNNGGPNSTTANNTSANSTPNGNTGANACTPSAEVCDGQDNDCDGEIDEDAVDAQDFFADTDSDSFGDNQNRVKACEAPEGFVATGGDCADDDASRNPQASELCDNIDNNCNGDTDELFADLEEPCTAGLGVCEATGVIVCSDDGSATECSAEPGLPTESPETTCDGIDADCDGVVDNGCDDDKDEWCDEDFVVTSDTALCAGGTQIGDCDDTDAEIHPGVLVGRCNGQDDDCDGEIDEIEEADSQPLTSEYAFPEGFSLEFGPDAAYQTSFERFAGIQAAPNDNGSWCIGATDRTSKENYIVHFDPTSASTPMVYTRSPGGFHVRDVAAIGNYCAALVGNDLAKRVLIMDVTTGTVQEVIPSQRQDQAFVRRGSLSAVNLNGVDSFVWTLVDSTGELSYQTIAANGVPGAETAAVTIANVESGGLSMSDVVGDDLWVMGHVRNALNTVEAKVFEVDLLTGSITNRGNFLGGRDGWVGGFASDGTSVRSIRYQQRQGATTGLLSIQTWNGTSWSATFGAIYGATFEPTDHLTVNTWMVEPLDPASARFWVLDSFQDYLRAESNGVFGTTYDHSALDYASGGSTLRHDLIAAQNLGGDVIQMLYVRSDELLPGATDPTAVAAIAEYSCF